MSDLLTMTDILNSIIELYNLLKKSSQSDIDECISLIEEMFPASKHTDSLLALIVLLRVLARRLEKGSKEPLNDGPSEEEFILVADDLKLSKNERKTLEQTFVDLDTPEELTAAFRYYNVTARHARNAGTPRKEPHISSDFRNTVRMVRVPLPERKDPKYAKYTAIGRVRADDHVVFSVEELNDARAAVYDGSLEPADSADVITGGRRALNRFAPVSLYLCSRAGKLCFWALQSSKFNGDWAYLYLARDMDGEIAVQSNYEPTPFAYRENLYTMRLRMKDDEPEKLSGELWSHSAQPSSVEPSQPPPTKPPASIHYRKYMTMTIKYVREDPTSALTSNPAMDQTIAFSRVCRIEDSVGVQGSKHPLEGEPAKLLHKIASALGEKLDWDIKPPPPVQVPPQ